MQRLWREYVRFEITGISPERFLNIANRRRLKLFNIHWFDGGMGAFIHASAFDDLAEAARKAGVELTVTRRFGLPRLLRRYRKRVGFFLGFGAFCGLLWYLSLFVWSVELVNVPPSLAVSASDAVYRAGLREGTLISRIEGPALEVELSEALPQFDFVTVSRMGCRAQVFFSLSARQERERRLLQKNAAAEHGTACDLVAAENGEIVKATASQGTPLVQTGDIVCAGDTLVSGLFEGQEGVIRMVHATGEITAMVEETFSETVDFVQTVKEPTGRVVTVYRPSVFGWEIPLFYRPPKGDYRRECEDRTVVLFRDLFGNGKGLTLPIELRREEWHELCFMQKTFTEDECIQQAEEALTKRIARAGSPETVSNTRTVTPTPTGLRVTRRVTFLRDIAVERELLLGSPS